MWRGTQCKFFFVSTKGEVIPLTSCVPPLVPLPWDVSP